MLKRIKWKYVMSSIILILMIFIFLSVEFSPQAIQQLNRLKEEYTTLPEYPGSKLSELKSGHKMSSASIYGYYYSSSANKDDIIKFYDEELKKQGWSFIKEKQISGFGKEISYKKGEDTFILSIPKDSNVSWAYSISLNWGDGY